MTRSPYAGASAFRRIRNFLFETMKRTRKMHPPLTRLEGEAASAYIFEKIKSNVIYIDVFIKFLVSKMLEK